MAAPLADRTGALSDRIMAVLEVAGGVPTSIGERLREGRLSEFERDCEDHGYVVGLAHGLALGGEPDVDASEAAAQAWKRWNGDDATAGYMDDRRLRGPAPTEPMDGYPAVEVHVPPECVPGVREHFLMDVAQEGEVLYHTGCTGDRPVDPERVRTARSRIVAATAWLERYGWTENNDDSAHMGATLHGTPAFVATVLREVFTAAVERANCSEVLSDEDAAELLRIASWANTTRAALAPRADSARRLAAA